MSRLALVIEDCDMIRPLVVEDLEAAGWRVIEADTYELGVHFWDLEREEIALVVTDNRMPPKVGLLPRECAHKIVRLARGECPVIVHSGDDLSHLEEPGVRFVRKASGVNLGLLANELVPRGVAS